MSIMPRAPDGFYDDDGHWQRTKFCFMHCGANCTCGPPIKGQYYSPQHDKKNRDGGREVGEKDG